MESAGGLMQSESTDAELTDTELTNAKYRWELVGSELTDAERNSNASLGGQEGKLGEYCLAIPKKRNS